MWVTHRGSLPASPGNSLRRIAKKPSETASFALVRKVTPGILQKQSQFRVHMRDRLSFGSFLFPAERTPIADLKN